MSYRTKIDFRWWSVFGDKRGMGHDHFSLGLCEL